MSTTQGIDQLLSQLRATSNSAAGAQENPAAGGVDFAAVLKEAVSQVSESQQSATEMAKAFGQGVSDANLHEVMASLQKANLSFQTMVQVRNKLVDAYRDVMNMQV